MPLLMKSIGQLTKPMILQCANLSYAKLKYGTNNSLAPLLNYMEQPQVGALEIIGR